VLPQRLPRLFSNLELAAFAVHNKAVDAIPVLDYIQAPFDFST
jgi:hypothetical protein